VCYYSYHVNMVMARDMSSCLIDKMIIVFDKGDHKYLKNKFHELYI